MIQSPSNMKKESSTAIPKRTLSDVGKVFPSGVRIDKSAYGLGVFAFAFIPKGTPIARVSGKIIKDANYSSDYCIDAGDDKVLEPGLPFCYLNHSCEPNCQLTHYVREADADESENLATGELTEEEMDFECNCEWDCNCDCIDDDAIYSDEAECNDTAMTEDAESDSEGQAFEDDADAEIWVETTLDIMPNEELTIDYAWTADRAMKCLCGKPSCRGWIVDPSERELLP